MIVIVRNVGGRWVREEVKEENLHCIYVEINQGEVRIVAMPSPELIEAEPTTTGRGFSLSFFGFLRYFICILAGSSNGRTGAFEASNFGSIPSPAAI